MHRIELKPAHVDDRGIIVDLLEEFVDSVTYITFEQNATRGNHFHEHTTQWSYVIEGTLEVYYLTKEGSVDFELFSRGEMFVSFPTEPHAFKAITRAEILVFTKGPRSGKSYLSDTKTYKLI